MKEAKNVTTNNSWEEEHLESTKCEKVIVELSVYKPIDTHLYEYVDVEEYVEKELSILEGGGINGGIYLERFINEEI